MRRIIPLSLLFGMACLLPATALAQKGSGPEVGVGYSFVRITEGEGLSMPVGWVASVGAPANGWLSLIGEVAGNYKSYSDGDTAWMHSFQGGVRASRRNETRFTPFGQFLLGGTHLRSYEGPSDIFSETHFSVEPGGGVDTAIKGRMGARVAVGFPVVFGEKNAMNAVRLQAGVVFRLGH